MPESRGTNTEKKIIREESGEQGLKAALRKISPLMSIVQHTRDIYWSNRIAFRKKRRQWRARWKRFQRRHRKIIASDLSRVDREYINRISEKLTRIPVSNGIRYYQKYEGRIGWLAEQFRYDALHSAMDGIILTPENWRDAVSEIDFLLVTSGWRGVNNAWLGFGKEESENRQIIYQVIEACKERGIPTVFYSVEDPPNYEIFIEIARRCDYVFTAAEEVIPRYRQDCGHDRVYLLKIPVNPLMHNPIGMRKFQRSRSILFAGSWMTKYPERIKDTRMLFDGALEAGRGLRIIDRNLLRPEAKYRFPLEYASYISPPVDHDTLQRIHKLYDWGITLNSVRHSKTMLANRGYEMLALGNLILSDNCDGVREQLPTAFLCDSKEKTARILSAMTQEEEYEREAAGVRYVLARDTCFDRMGTILTTIGKSVNANGRSIAVVLDKGDTKGYEAFQRQTYGRKRALTVDELKTEYEKFDMITFFSEDAYYGDFYLEDMINGFKYTDSDYITKSAYMLAGKLQEGTEHDYVAIMPDKTRTVFWRKSFSWKELEGLNGSVEMPNGYSIDHFEYEAEPWNKEASDTKAEPKITVILPAMNDGWYLYGRAFSSLQRHPLFSQMEIICVDAGSTDERQTIALMHMLRRRYNHVSVIEAGERIRSLPEAAMMGILKARAPWITVLPARMEADEAPYEELLMRTESGDVNERILRRGIDDPLWYMLIHREHADDKDARALMERWITRD